MVSVARLLLSGLLLPASVFAVDTIQFELDSLETSFFSTATIELRYAPENNPQAGISLSMEKIQSPWFEQDFDVSFRCSKAAYDIQKLRCDNGALKIIYPALGEITVGIKFDINMLDYSGTLSASTNTKWGNVTANYNGSQDRNWLFDFRSEDLQLSGFSRLLGSNLSPLSNHSIVSGSANTHITLSGNEKEIDGVTLDLDLAELSIEGENILENVDLQLHTSSRQVQESWSFRNTLKLDKGEMYIQPGIALAGGRPGFYLAFTTEPGEVKVNGSWTGEKELLELDEISFSHPEILELQGKGRFLVHEGLQVETLSLDVIIPELADSYPVYIQPLLLHTNFNDMELSGAVELGLDYQHSQLKAMELVLNDVYLDDLGSRFSISALNSHLLIDSGPGEVLSTLGWEGMSFYRLDLGAGDIVFESAGNNVRVLSWADVTILDGALNINEFNIRNLGTSDFELSLGGELRPISMKLLTHALGWTMFPGQLSGEISGLKYRGNNLILDGDILVKMFGGLVSIKDLRVEDMFSTYSVLSTDIRLERLDLEQLTDVFTFGKIEGSLDGRIDSLRLEDWTPAYFEAEFATPSDDDKPHRISQKALENINELGGGMTGTLSNGFLRFLPAYSYGRLGISCRLANGICELGGVEDEGGGFSILTRGGILPPWVEVRGTGRAIKWADLVGGLKQIAAGEVKIE